jgi:hypothetical protein
LAADLFSHFFLLDWSEISSLFCQFYNPIVKITKMLIFVTTDRRGIECSGFTQLQFISSRNDETFSEPGLNLCCGVIGFSMHNWEVQLKEISK